MSASGDGALCTCWGPGCQDQLGEGRRKSLQELPSARMTPQEKEREASRGVLGEILKQPVPANRTKSPRC